LDLALGQDHRFGVETKVQAQLAALNGFNNGQLGSTGLLNADQVAVVEGRGAQGSALGIDEGQQGHDAGALDGGGQIALLLGCEASQAAGKDLAALGDEFLQQIDILVVDRLTGLDRREALLEEGTAHWGTDEMNYRKAGSRRRDHLISLWTVDLLQWGQNFFSSIRSVVFRRFFSVV
jgi:hypothetical protein